MTAQIEREDANGNGRYVLRQNGYEAELTYAIRDGVIRLRHTGVPEALGGQGIGARLVAQAVEDARANDLKVDPACSYAAAQFKKHPEWADLLQR